MIVTSSYGVEMRKQNICFRKTMEVYRCAVMYLTEVLNEAWEELAGISNAKRRFNAAERLVHTTKKNQARFDFDRKFPKMPSYLRRSAIQHALGSVSSCRTRQASGSPVLPKTMHAMPVFYRDVMYREGAPGSDCAYLKLYDGHDWIWREVRLLHTDMEYLRKHWSHAKASAPTLVKKHKKYFLMFTFQESVTLTQTPAERQKICAVDLGIRNDAVCSIMESDGTVLARRFIRFPGDKDRLCHVLGRIRRFQREHPGSLCRGSWKYAVRLNEELAKKTAASIVDFAEENQADVIVFEYLEMKGKIRGSRKQRLHLWRKRDVQKRCEHQAHRKGMRISRICAWNTSALAFDGSGRVQRDPGNHSMCTFRSGKNYNCDLSASYNIGARYFIRERIKPLPEMARSLLEAEVPAVMRRTSCVYADLLKMQEVLGKTVA